MEEENKAPTEEPITEETPAAETPPEVASTESTPEPTPAPASEPEPKPKKKFPFLTILLIILALGSVVGTYFLIKANQKPEQITVQDELPPDEDKFLETSTEILFTGDNLPHVDAAIAIQPLMNAYLKNFTGQTPEQLNISYGDSHTSIVKLAYGYADLVISTAPTDEEIKTANSKGVEFEITKVVNDGFVFFVNKDNPVESVNLDNLPKIYTGEITNWKDLGGNDAAITAFQYPEGSYSQNGLRTLVMKDQDIKIPAIKSNPYDYYSYSYLDYIALYDNSPNALGYSSYHYANLMYKTDQNKYLAVNDVKPNYSTIHDESYPIINHYYIITRKGEQNENVALLKKAILSRRGQFVTSEAGYVTAQ